MNRSWLLIYSLAFLNSIPGYAQQTSKSNRDEDERAIREIEALASEALATKDLLGPTGSDRTAINHSH